MKNSNVQNPVGATKEKVGQHVSDCPISFWEDFVEKTKAQTGQRRDSINQTVSYGKNVKKMCPHKKILSYTYPSLYEGKVWYIGFYAEDPATGRMRRKRYKLEHIKGAKEKRRYAQRMIFQLMDMLDQGWNPWVPEEPSILSPEFGETCDRYLDYVEARARKGTLRADTVRSYRSYLNVFRTWCTERKRPVSVCSQLTKAVCSEFLDYVYMDMNASACTRNCYKVWMSGSLFAWMVERGILKERPTDGIKSLPKITEPKSRSIIPEKELLRLREYLEAKCPHYLLIVYLLYYCFIRPKELSMLRLRDINLKKGIITIPGEISKNKRTDCVTLPTKVIHYMLDLGIFDSPASYYLFSDDFRPGRVARKPKAMRDWWQYHIMRDFRWPKEYQLYSLKDTGITRLLHHVDALTVRDQARHSDISITNIYAQQDGEAVEVLRNLDDVL